jgi:hypothetical protein
LTVELLQQYEASIMGINATDLYSKTGLGFVSSDQLDLMLALRKLAYGVSWFARIDEVPDFEEGFPLCEKVSYDIRRTLAGSERGRNPCAGRSSC